MPQQRENTFDEKGRTAKIYISSEVFCGDKKVPAKVYVHLKGRLRARVTHIDVEHPLLQKCAPHLCQVKVKHWPDIYHIPGGFALDTDPELKVKSKALEKHIPETPTQAMVGGKGSRGIFIGLPKEIKDSIRQDFDPRVKGKGKGKSTR